MTSSCRHQCGIVGRKGQCRNKPKLYDDDNHILVAREGWPKPDFHFECTFHFNRYAFTGGVVVTTSRPCAQTTGEHTT